MYSYLKCIVCDKLLKPRQSFRIALYLLHSLIATYLSLSLCVYVCVCVFVQIALIT